MDGAKGMLLPGIEDDSHIGLLGNKIFIYHDDIGYVRYVSHMGTEKSIVNAARVSYDNDDNGELTDKDSKLIEYLIKNKHTSTLEHNVITFEFKVPMFVRSQHHRHRTWSYNEISGRYAKLKDEFYFPLRVCPQSKDNRQGSDYDSDCPEALGCLKTMRRVCESSYNAYSKFLSMGVAREQARMILPSNVYTRYIGTVNLNNLLRFFVLRCDVHAQLEMRLMSGACFDIANAVWPGLRSVMSSYMKKAWEC